MTFGKPMHRAKVICRKYKEKYKSGNVEVQI